MPVSPGCVVVGEVFNWRAVVVAACVAVEGVAAFAVGAKFHLDFGLHDC